MPLASRNFNVLLLHVQSLTSYIRYMLILDPWGYHFKYVHKVPYLSCNVLYPHAVEPCVSEVYSSYAGYIRFSESALGVHLPLRVSF